MCGLIELKKIKTECVLGFWKPFSPSVFQSSSYLKFTQDVFAITLKIGTAKFSLGLVNWVHKVSDLHQSLLLCQKIVCENLKLVSNGFEETLNGSTLDTLFSQWFAWLFEILKALLSLIETYRNTLTIQNISNPGCF